MATLHLGTEDYDTSGVNGKVGIGTTSPDTLLHLVDNNHAITLSGGGGSAAGDEIEETIIFRTPVQENVNTYDAWKWRIGRVRIDSDYDSRFSIMRTTRYGVTDNEDFTISPAGNVGIGTTNPQNKLDVEGAVAIGAGYSGTNQAPTNGLLVEGNVGIGTTTPNYKLDVNGDMNLAAGNVYRIGGVAQSGSSKWTQGAGDNIYRNIGNVSIGTSALGEKLSVDGNIETLDGDHIKSDEVRARDGDGLKLYDDGGNGIFVQDGGKVGIGTTDPQAYKLSVVYTGDTAISGTSQSGYGVVGTSNYHGVGGFSSGIDHYGVYGEATAAGGRGVYGEATNGIGVYGETDEANGKWGFYTANKSYVGDCLAINTESPADGMKLHVIGDIRIDGTTTQSEKNESAYYLQINSFGNTYFLKLYVTPS
ncbi:MAG: hypothetical protein ABIJ15_08530 [bacterium]